LIKNLCSDKLNNTEKLYLQFLRNSAVEMKNSIDSLLQFSIVNNNTLSYDKINLIQFFEEITSIDYPYHNIEIDIKVKFVDADRNLLRTVFKHLIENAIKFSRKNVECKIEIGNKEVDDKIIFWVKDNGIGIEEEYHKQIFGIFKKLHLKSKQNGNGIGLALCKTIVEKHFGKIWVQSIKNRGSKFFFTIEKY